MVVKLKFKIGQTVSFKHKDLIKTSRIKSFLITGYDNQINILYELENCPYYLKEELLYE